MKFSNVKQILDILGAKYETEYRFHPKRRWRFDYAIKKKILNCDYPDIEKIAIEYEGIFSKKSRHTTMKGYDGDCEKYNEAVLMDWKVIRITQLMLNDGRALDIIERALN